MQLEGTFLALERGSFTPDGADNAIAYYRLHLFDTSKFKYSRLKLKSDVAEEILASGVKLGDLVSVGVEMTPKYTFDRSTGAKTVAGEELAVIEWK